MMAALDNQQQSTSLKQLLVDLCVTEYLPDVEVYGLTLDSRKVEPGYAFVAMEGEYDHGLAYAEKAIERGAVVVFCDADFDQYCQQILSKIMTRVMCVPVKNLQRKLGTIAGRLYAYPADELLITGITGTDGKTSVSHFVAQALDTSENPAAIIGTLGNGLLNALEESTHTTPDVISVHEMLHNYHQAGAASVAMEVSSHGLDQNRVAEVEFDIAVLTNLSRDHLDYHGTIESYKQAKKKLFSNSAAKSLVLNIDDNFGQEIFELNAGDRPVWLYGVNKQRVMQSELYAYAEDLQLNADGMSFMLCSSLGVAPVRLKLIGEFNIYNALACFCVCVQSGMNFNHAIKRLEKLTTVAGRMEMIATDDAPSVVIDYAHTPEALSQALINARKHVEGKLICLFGCGGDRDAGKRPLMAQVADELSDLVIVTNDNPRNEDPDRIIDDIKAGIGNAINLIVEEDREQAIKQAISIASKDDLVLIAGKGHEQFQLIGNKKIPFSDKAVALKYLGVDR